MSELSGRLVRSTIGSTIDSRIRSISLTFAPSPKNPMSIHTTVSSMNNIPRLSNDNLKLKFALFLRVGFVRYTTVGTRQSALPTNKMGRKYA